MSITVAIFDREGVTALTRWGYFVATCLQKELTILCIHDAAKTAPVVRARGEETDHPLGRLVQEELKTAPSVPVTGVGDDAPDDPRAIRIVELSDPDPLDAVLGVLGDYKSELLLVRKHRSSRGEEGAMITPRLLFEQAPCATLLLRPGEADPLNCKRLLVPVAGGPHAIKALGVARDIAVAVGGELVPLFVASGFGLEARAVGRRVLDEILAKAGVEAGPNVTPEVMVSDQPLQVIGEKSEENFDLVIMGASNVGKLRKLLFGTIPNRLLSGDDATAVSVIRNAKPVMVRMQETLGHWLDLVIPQMERDDRVALFHTLQTKSVWNFDFMTLIALSTAIAALGLIQNSTAVVIGAMLVAPLMTPMLGAGLALVQGNYPLMRKAAQSIVLGYVMALAIGMLIGFVSGVDTLTPELLARGGHRVSDLAVALLSGMAAAYCIARPGLSAALAGVAIAAALVPPVATTGICLVMKETAHAQGSALLFATNLVAIILGAAISFYAAGIRGNPELAGSARWVHRTLVGLLIVAVVLFLPLGSRMVSWVSGKPYIHAAREQKVLERLYDPLGDQLGGEVTSIREDADKTPTLIDLYLSAPAVPGGHEIGTCLRMLEGALERPVHLRLHTELVVTVERGDGG